MLCSLVSPRAPRPCVLIAGVDLWRLPQESTSHIYGFNLGECGCGEMESEEYEGCAVGPFFMREVLEAPSAHHNLFWFPKLPFKSCAEARIRPPLFPAHA